MILLAACSVKGAPGMTIGLLALALSWPREVLLVEADPAGSDLRAGFLQAAAPVDLGLLSLALEVRRGDADVTGQALAVNQGQTWVVPGLIDPAQRETVLPAWPRMVGSLTSTGRDVLIDVGRFDPAVPLLRSAQPTAVLLAIAPTLAGVDRAYRLIGRLRGEALSVSGTAQLGLLVIGAGPYPPVEVARTLDVPLFGVLPHDPRGARALAAGRVEPRSALLRAARSVAGELADRLDAPVAAPHGRSPAGTVSR